MNTLKIIEGQELEKCTHEIVEFGRCAGCGQSIEHDDEDTRILAIRTDSAEIAKSWHKKNEGKCIFCKKSYRLSPQEGGCYC